MVVVLVLIFEVIVFLFIVGVDFKVGLYVVFFIVVVIVIVGGWLGMIFVVIGVMVLVMVDLVKDYGLQYLFVVSILVGLLQVLVGVFKFGLLM